MFTLLLLFAINPDLTEAINLSRAGDYNASEKIFKRHPSQEPEHTFYRMINAYGLNRKEETIKHANDLIYSFTAIPIRYHDMAILLKEDAKTWKHEKSDLGDIAREMNKVHNRLKNAKGGPETQKIQRDIASRLAAIIKKVEDDRRKAQEAKEAAEARANGNDQQTQPTPPPEAPNGQERGTGLVESKKIRELAEVWGKLPEKKRAKALRELMRSFPKGDRSVIEAYFRELNKRSK